MRVHIAPVGFEIDRIVIPAIKMKADRVWLILHDRPGEDHGLTFRDKISKQLKQSSIECKSEVADRTDLFDTLRGLRKIIHIEAKNTLLVNVSVGSKIQSIACTLICMMFKDKITIKPYYATPEKYTSIPQEQETVGVNRIISLPDYKIEMPPDNLIRCLEIISSRKDAKISKKELMVKALDMGLIHVEKNEHKEQSAYMALKNNLIAPLLKWKFITIEKIGRQHSISLTQDGLNALKFLSLDSFTI